MAKDIVPFNVRFPKDLHSDLKELAMADNRSLQNYIITVLKRHVEENLTKEIEGQMNFFEENPSYNSNVEIPERQLSTLEKLMLLNSIKIEDQSQLELALIEQNEIITAKLKELKSNKNNK